MNQENYDEEEDIELEEEMLLRNAKLLFPEVEEWILKIAVKGHLNLNGRELKRDIEKAEEYKKRYSTELNYTT